MEDQPMSAGDLRYLLDLGLTIEEIAARAGRTPLAITRELEKDQDNEQQ
jgi:IS30 family transposase